MDASAWQGLVVGFVVGGLFAWLQLLALQRNELLQRQQQLPTTLRLIPGSMTRVVVLLLALVLTQVLFPAANLWWLTGGLLLALAIPLGWRLNRMRKG